MCTCIIINIYFVWSFQLLIIWKGAQLYIVKFDNTYCNMIIICNRHTLFSKHVIFNFCWKILNENLILLVKAIFGMLNEMLIILLFLLVIWPFLSHCVSCILGTLCNNSKVSSKILLTLYLICFSCNVFMRI